MRTVRWKTALADAILLALVVLLTGVAVFAATRLYTTAENRYVDEALPIRYKVSDTLVQMLNEETGVRGYLITGDPSSLEPYERARSAVAGDLDALDRLAKRRPEIAGDLASERRLVDRLEGYYMSQILLATRGRRGRLEAEQNVLAGKKLFDRFRATSTRLVDRAKAVVDEAN